MAAVTLKDAPADAVITTYAALLKRQGKVRLTRGREWQQRLAAVHFLTCSSTGLFFLFLSLSLSLSLSRPGAV